MKNCRNCGGKLENGQKLCPACAAEAEPESEGRRAKKGPRWVILAAIVALSLAALLAYPLIRAVKSKQQEATVYKTATITPPCETIILTTPTPDPAEAMIIANPTPSAQGEETASLKLSRALPHIFYNKRGTLYHLSGSEVKPESVTMVPSNAQNVPPICISDDGSKLLYPNGLDTTKTDFYANLYACDLESNPPVKVKIDTGVSAFGMNSDGSRICYIKDRALYSSDGVQSRKLSEKVTEFHLNQKGDCLIYRTQDCRLFYVNQDGPAREIATGAYLVYVSKDLNTIYYFSNKALCLLKDGKEVQTIASGIYELNEKIIHIYEDGSLYYFKRVPLKKADYVNDDLADSDAALREPNPTDYPDQSSYDIAKRLYEEKLNRDEIRKELQKADETVFEVDGLYYYSKGVTTKISGYCRKVWRYSDAKRQEKLYSTQERPVLAYEQIKLDRINLSEVTHFDQIKEYILNYYPGKTEQFICQGAQVLGRFAEGELHQVSYDVKNNQIYYVSNYRKNVSWGDLYCVKTDESVLTGSLYEKDIILPYEPSTLLIGDMVVYFRNGKNMAEDFNLFVNHEKVDIKVTGWIYPLKNEACFLYENPWTDGEHYSKTFYLYHNGKVQKIADRVLGYQGFDENCIVYVVNREDNVKQLCLYDGSETRILLDTFYSGEYESHPYFAAPVLNPYLGYAYQNYP